MSRESKQFHDATARATARKAGIDLKYRRGTTTQKQQELPLLRQIMKGNIAWGTPIVKDI